MGAYEVCKEILFMSDDLTFVIHLNEFRKFADFSRYLRFLAVLCHVNVHCSRVHDHLILMPFADFTKFALSPKSFRFT